MIYLCYTHIKTQLKQPVWIVVTSGSEEAGGRGYVISHGFWIGVGGTFEFGSAGAQERLKNRRFFYEDKADVVPDEALAAYTQAILEGKIHDPRRTT